MSLVQLYDKKCDHQNSFKKISQGTNFKAPLLFPDIMCDLKAPSVCFTKTKETQFIAIINVFLHHLQESMSQ